MLKHCRGVWLAGAVVATTLAAQPAAPSEGAAPASIFGRASIFSPVVAPHAMVSSQEAHATRAGLEILQAGGNAVDAAVAVHFALAVTLPQAGNLGGGGFLLLRTPSGEVAALDYRETAPARAGRDMFIDPATGRADATLSQRSHLASGVPGSVAGLAEAQARYGRRPWAELLAPAIRLAEEGFPVYQELHDSLRSQRQLLFRSGGAKAVFFPHPGDEPVRAGERLRQPALASTLRALAEGGAAAFYQGPIAAAFVADQQAHGGLITAADLAAYRPVWRTPVQGTYRGYTIWSMPPPSSGGVHLIQILNILECWDMAAAGAGSAQALHWQAEAMRRAYADRATYLGDPDHHPVPVAALTDKRYAAALRAQIEPRRATPSTAVGPGDLLPYESPETTHFSVVDADGLAVSNTTTINLVFGNGHLIPELGFLLNNEMDDFSAQPGVPNAFGLLGGEANAIAPGKRPLSSMTPTLVADPAGQTWLVTGSPGGSRIITTVLQIVLQCIDFRQNIAAASAAPRVHHQWQPDELRHEPGLSPDTLELLRQWGHQPALRETMGSTQSLLRAGPVWTGASDPRTPYGLAAGY